MFKNEIDFLENCKSKYIVKLYYADPNNKFIILEKGDCTLYTALLKKLISSKDACKIIHEIKAEFKLLKIIHRDLSYHNMIYFIKTHKIKIIDFEISSYKKTDIKNIYPKHRKKVDNFGRLCRYIKQVGQK